MTIAHQQIRRNSREAAPFNAVTASKGGKKTGEKGGLRGEELSYVPSMAAGGVALILWDAWGPLVPSDHL